MLIIIDNYDSFTYNLVHYLGELGAECRVFRNDAISVEEVLALQPQGIVLSPGPGYPQSAGICLGVVAKAADTVPLLGVCLGHQAIGRAFGGRIVRAPTLMHGKLSAIRHDGHGLFQGLPQGFEATRYHSLVVERESLPETLQVNAETGEGVIMGLAHRDRPIFGVQFHPESIASEHGHALLANFIRATGQQPAGITCPQA